MILIYLIDCGKLNNPLEARNNDNDNNYSYSDKNNDNNNILGPQQGRYHCAAVYHNFAAFPEIWLKKLK